MALVNLGFGGDRKIESGSHICAVYDNRSQLMDILVPFIACGLDNRELCVVVGDDALMADVRRALSERGMNPDRYVIGEQLLFLTAIDHYYAESRFNVERLVRAVDDLMELVISQGFQSARVAGDNTPVMDHIVQSLGDWVQYEARLNVGLRGKSVVALCIYNQRRTPGQVMTTMLKTHPLVVMDGVIHENPFYQEPDQLLGGLPAPGEIT
ncbi:hypothetical protein AMK68_02345 [candidate division KD3-62 bacterium DG_56]|uniref:MEDS domain-containing protein n=1 Tax=candidate division KD3-62 bacterium DG_56 TaxID=1704032 RepID=A0A0S7XNZ4_9BACT|nr:MAG: hypothetical protein AMK68_02345 [candidate division KD3-62 bacterium DG_56]